MYTAGVTKFGPGEFSSNPNQTHLKRLIKVLQGMLETSRQVCRRKVGDKLCRTPALQDQV